MIGKGGHRDQSDKNKAEAAERAQRLAPVMAELSGLSANAAGEELNRRGIATAEGGRLSIGVGSGPQIGIQEGPLRSTF